MATTIPAAKAEQQLTGVALKNLREARRPKLSQRTVGAALKMTGANYQQYEAGERSFPDDVIDRILEILGATHADLEREKASILGHPPAPSPVMGFGERGRSFVMDVFPQGAPAGDARTPAPTRRLDLAQVLGPNLGALEVSDDLMSPWAEPGESVIFDRDRHPKRGAGCVVEMVDGQLLPRIYERTDGSTLFVQELNPKRTQSWPLVKVRAVYAIRLRGD